MKLVIAVMVCSAAASPALAQVGHPPSSSPYHDVQVKQELTLFGGYFKGSSGKVGVAPTGGPLVGVRYGIRLGGPVQFTTRVARAFSERTILDPAETGAAQVIGTESWPVYLVDVGLGLDLTGEKSFHDFVPVVGVGLGAASDGGKSADVGDYAFGTAFALTFNAGLRWTPGGRYQLRAGITDYMYQLSYPASYFTIPESGSSALLPPNASRKQWTHNPVFSLGITYVISR